MKKKIITILILVLSLFTYKNVYAASTKAYIDYPIINQEVNDTLKIQGWVMSDTQNTLKVYIDNEEIEVDRQVREDVYKALKEYDREKNPNNGFIKEVNIKNKYYGEHTVKLEVLDETNNVLLSDQKKFIRVQPKSRIFIDHPSINQEAVDTLKIQGWAMSQINNNIRVYIDNEVIEVDREIRNDVYRAVKEYGTRETNPNNGFIKEVNIKNLSYGEHIVKVEVLDESNNVLCKQTQKFTRRKPNTKTYIDYPSINQKVKDTLKIQGWVMSETQNTLKVYVDNEEIEVDREVREDVYKALKEYDKKTNPNNGFIKEVNIKNLSYGEHIVKIEVLDENENILTKEEKKFIRKTPNSRINIDFPSTNVNGDTLLINGWYLCEEQDTSLEIYFDNKKIDDYEQKERPDVYNVYPSGYGRNTLYPGFNKELDVSTEKDGNHTITAIIRSNNGQEILKTIKIFYLKKVNGKMYIDFLEQSHKKIGYYLSGWEMSTKSGSYIKTYIDNQEVEYTHNRVERNDVIKAIKDYGDKSVNNTPGYIGYVDISNIGLGEHNLKVVLYSEKNEEITSINQRINIVTKQYEMLEGEVKKLQYDAIYYNQYDGRWANNKYGFSKFGSTGCAPTSMAMAFSGILGKTIIPTDVANYLYYSTNEYNKYTKGTSGVGIIYATDKYHIKRTGINSLEELNKSLKEGKLVFCVMGNGIYGTRFWNHAIIVKEYNNGKTYSYDPLTTNNNRWIDTSTIWSQKSTDPDDYRGGSVFYALESYN